MKFGISMFMTEYSIGPVALGKALEERGFETVFLSEHSHIPASRESPWPLGEGLPKEYIHSFDPFVALTAIAAVTTTLNVGTGICLVVERDPITLAKEVATLDVVSRGRFLFGVGAGWNLEEMRNHGTDPARRFGLLRERIEAMKTIWAEEEASYRGKSVNFDRIWAWPKPVQRPHPPILVGTETATTQALRRVASYGDGWFPLANLTNPEVDARLGDYIRELNELAAEQGRGPLEVTVAAMPDPATIERYAAAGVKRCVFVLPSVTEPEALAVLDQYAPVVAQFREAVAI